MVMLVHCHLYFHTAAYKKTDYDFHESDLEIYMNTSLSKIWGKKEIDDDMFKKQKR